MPFWPEPASIFGSTKPYDVYQQFTCVGLAIQPGSHPRRCSQIALAPRGALAAFRRATLSRPLRTQPLPVARGSVGYRRRNTGFLSGRSHRNNYSSDIRSHVSGVNNRPLAAEIAAYPPPRSVRERRLRATVDKPTLGKVVSSLDMVGPQRNQHGR